MVGRVSVSLQQKPRFVDRCVFNYPWSDLTLVKKKNLFHYSYNDDQLPRCLIALPEKFIV